MEKLSNLITYSNLDDGVTKLGFFYFTQQTDDEDTDEALAPYLIAVIVILVLLLVVAVVVIMWRLNMAKKSKTHGNFSILLAWLFSKKILRKCHSLVVAVIGVIMWWLNVANKAEYFTTIWG